MKYTHLPQIPVEPKTRIGRQLQGGQLTVTGRSEASGKHLTISLRSRRRNAKTGRWERSSAATADVIFVEEGTGGYGSYQLGRFFRNREGKLAWRDTSYHTASPVHSGLIYLLEQTLSEATDKGHSSAIVLKSADTCGICRRQLTDPESIDRGIGPDCFGKSTSSKKATEAVPS